MLDSTNKTTTATPANSPKTDATQAFRARAESGSARAKEAFEKMSAARAEAIARRSGIAGGRFCLLLFQQQLEDHGAAIRHLDAPDARGGRQRALAAQGQ